MTIKELADMVADILGVKDKTIVYGDWLPGDIKVFDIDNRKIRTALGLDFITDFRKGLDLTVEWARDYFRRTDETGD